MKPDPRYTALKMISLYGDFAPIHCTYHLNLHDKGRIGYMYWTEVYQEIINEFIGEEDEG
jgi:hypothetical protein